MSSIDNGGTMQAAPALSAEGINGAPPVAGNVPPTDPTVEKSKREDLTKLGPYVMAGWTLAKTHRRESGIEERLLQCLRDISGVYSADETAKITALNQPLVFIPNPDLKRRTCNAILRSVFFESYDPFYRLSPSPVPEISNDDAAKIADEVISEYTAVRISEFVDQGYPIQMAEEMAYRTPPDPDALAEYVESKRSEFDNKRTEEAKIKVERMSSKIKDQRLDGGYDEAFMQVVDYCSSFGTGVLKGPVRRIRNRVHFDGGKCVLKPTEVLEWEATHPLNSYPEKGSRDIQKGGYYERVEYTARELSDMAKLGTENGYFPDAIRRVLNLYPNGGCVLIEPTDSERSRLENNGTIVITTTSILQGIEAFLDVKGSMLRSLGILAKDDGTAIDDDEYYDANCIVIAGEVVFCTLTDEMFGRPLYKGVFYKVPNSWWGYSPIDKMRDPVRAYNNAYRAKCVNTSCCSGPMFFYNAAKLLPGQKVEVRPYAAVGWSDPIGNSQPPVRAFQPASNIDEITRDLDSIEKLIDHVTGIPSTSHMDDTAASAGRTYNGMLLLIQAQKQGANDVVLSLFNDVSRKALTYLYRYNMLYDPDEGIKGDCEVEAGGLLAILTREQNRAALESFLNMVIASPVIQQKIGDPGMMELLRVYIQTLDGINPDKIIPSEEERARRQKIAEIQNGLAMYQLGAPQAAQGAQQGVAPVQQQPAAPMQPMAPQGPMAGVSPRKQPLEMNP